MGRPDFLVVGAGVSGLSTAVLLAEGGHRVHVVAALPPRLTTSAMAGASWAPCLDNDERTPQWAEVTRSALESLAGQPHTGVRLVPGLEVSEDPGDPPAWATRVPQYRPWSAEERQTLWPRYHSGWHYRIPLVDMPVYLDYLADRLAAAR
jgi:D-amino-acid oxidase